MKIYIAESRDDYNEHQGYFYTLSKSEAKNHIKEAEKMYPNNTQELQLKEVYVPFNKHDIIAFLNEHCSHPDNG